MDTGIPLATGVFVVELANAREAGLGSVVEANFGANVHVVGKVILVAASVPVGAIESVAVLVVAVGVTTFGVSAGVFGRLEADAVLSTV